jgi:protein-tyrosine-phosphatase
LHELGYDTGFARSKRRDDFAREDGSQMDFVFTVCDSAASEECPYWPGAPLTSHWGLPDPAAASVSLEYQRAAFRNAYDTLQARIEAFIAAAPDSSGPREALNARLAMIGTLEAS